MFTSHCFPIQSFHRRDDEYNSIGAIKSFRMIPHHYWRQIIPQGWNNTHTEILNNDLKTKSQHWLLRRNESCKKPSKKESCFLKSITIKAICKLSVWMGELHFTIWHVLNEQYGSRSGIFKFICVFYSSLYFWWNTITYVKRSKVKVSKILP